MQDKRAALEAERRRISAALGELDAQERKETAHALVGKCFKYRNCYSCPEKPSDYWWLYFRIDAVTDGGWLACVTVQCDKYGEVKIAQKHRAVPEMFQGGGYVAITRREWDQAVKRIMDGALKVVRRGRII